MAIMTYNTEYTTSNDSIEYSTGYRPASHMPAHSPEGPAHHQFLPQRAAHSEYENLKGIPHRRTSDDDGYEFYDDDSTSSDYPSQMRLWLNNDNKRSGIEKLSSVKKRGGGSWLLGFARLRSVEESSEERYGACSSPVPGLVRSTSDEDLSTSQHSTASSASSSSSTSSSSSSSRKKGVSFNESVKILPIPHSSSYTPHQKKKMYSTSHEVRMNKIRNKKEYRYDGYDWRNVTEEWEMGVDMVTGELVHPVHSME